MVTDEAPADWTELTARYATRVVWLDLMWDDKPRAGPWLLPDGRRLADVLSDGDIEQIPFPIWFKRRSGARWGDLLWTIGLPIVVASTRFVDVLEAVGATGWKTYPVDVLDQEGERRDYVGLVPTTSDPRADVRHQWEFPSFSLLVRAHVLEALIAAGVDDFRAEGLVVG